MNLAMALSQATAAWHVTVLRGPKGDMTWKKGLNWS
jgi:hypothetical protein